MSYHANTFNGNILQWQGPSQRAPELVHIYILRLDTINSFVSARIGVRPFRFFFSLLSGLHNFISRLALIPSIVQEIVFRSASFSFFLLFRVFSHGISIIILGATNTIIMPAKGGSGSIAARMVALRKQREERAEAEKKSADRERVLEGDVHALQLTKEEAKRRQDQKARGIEVQKLRDEAQRARKEEARQHEAILLKHLLLDGIQDLK